MTGSSLVIWTVGHSTRTIEEFIDLLRRYQIEILVDVRHFPGSRRLPHFNKAALHRALAAAGIHYEHLIELGGRRPARPDSHNLLWRNASFRGYADYMETKPFRDGVDRLVVIDSGNDRFSSRGEADFADKVLSAIRYAFGGHVEKTASATGDAR